MTLPDDFVTVGDLADLPDDGICRVEIDGTSVLLVRHAGAVHACQAICPHDKADLTGGRVENGRLVCPRHLASFGLDDGRPSAGWRHVENLRLYPVNVVGESVAVDRAALRRNPPGGAREVWDFTKSG